MADLVARFRDAYDARNVDAVVDLFAEHGDWRIIELMVAQGEKGLERS